MDDLVDEGTVVGRSVILAAEPDEVWALLHEDGGEGLGAWLGDQVEVEVRPGGPGRVVDDDGVARELCVQEVDPGRRLSWLWWPEDGGPVSSVEITIDPVEPGTGAGTRVTVIEAPVMASWMPIGMRASASASASAPVSVGAAGLEGLAGLVVGGRSAWAGRFVSLELSAIVMVERCPAGV